MLEVWLQVFLCTVQEAMRLEVSSTKGQKVNSCQTCLLARGNKHNDWQLGREAADGIVHRFYHGKETRGSVCDIEALDRVKKERERKGMRE